MFQAVRQLLAQARRPYRFFVSYRHEDAEWPAKQIRDGLVDYFGQESVSMDVHQRGGADFRTILVSKVRESDAVLVVIGDTWLESFRGRESASDAQALGDETEDWVLVEIEAALEHSVPLWPILVSQNPMPAPGDLPTSIQRLAFFHARELTADADYQGQFDRLKEDLRSQARERRADRRREDRARRREQFWAAVDRRQATLKRLALSIGGASVIIAAAYVWVVVLRPAPTEPAAEPEEIVSIRVIDVGPGLCSVIHFPTDEFMVVDAGPWPPRDSYCVEGIQRVMPPGSVIDLLVLSHSDADHIGAVPALLENYGLREVLRTGLERETNIWRRSDEAIKDEFPESDIVLRDNPDERSFTRTFGDARVDMISGFYEPPEDWIGNVASARNAGSIVLLLSYRGTNVLFGGDATSATENYILSRRTRIPIKADVLIAPHAGADNSSTVGFIEAVSPKYVVFSAGHLHMHPRAVVAARYLQAGVLVENMFRTDLGDDEGDREWDFGRIDGTRDPAGDDDIEIILTPGREPIVRYVERSLAVP